MIRSPWLSAARLQLHTIGFAPLLLGNIAAWYEQGRFSWLLFILSALIGLLLHLVTAFANDAADIETDAHNAMRSPFSGGSGVIVKGRLRPFDLIVGAGLAAVLSLILTAVTVFVLNVHWGLFLFLAWGLLSGSQYSLPPLKIAYRGGGEFLVLLTYSIALVWAGYFVQVGPALPLLPVYLSVPIGFSVFSLIAVTQFPDRDADLKAGKRSLVILLGERTALNIIAAAVVLCLLSIFYLVLAGLLPLWPSALYLLCIPLALGLLKMAFTRHRGPVVYSVLAQGLLILTLWLGLAPALGLVLSRWIS